jgi:head-tail adaptor
MADKVDIGRFDEIVELLECHTTRGTRGEKIETYVPERKTVAHVEPATSETDADSNIYSGRSIVVSMYAVPEMSTRWRIAWRGTPYNIKTIDTIDRLSPFVRVYAQEVMK